VLAQASGFAFLAALSPTAIVVASVFLASENPRRTALFFLLGALAMTAIVSLVIFVALRAGGLSHPSEREPRFGLRLGLGVVALLASLVLARLKPREPKPTKKPNLVARLTARPGPKTAFAVGLIVFTPSITYVAAVQVIATAQAGFVKDVVGLVLVAGIAMLFAWLPLVLFLVAPEATTRGLKTADGWVRTYGRTLLIVGLAIGGLALTVDGALGLAG
jgi:Sap, sulfolipid-1-addressing protein